jgi:hypothetical protein
MAGPPIASTLELAASGEGSGDLQARSETSVPPASDVDVTAKNEIMRPYSMLASNQIPAQLSKRVQSSDRQESRWGAPTTHRTAKGSIVEQHLSEF